MDQSDEGGSYKLVAHKHRDDGISNDQMTLIEDLQNRMHMARTDAEKDRYKRAIEQLKR